MRKASQRWILVVAVTTNIALTSHAGIAATTAVPAPETLDQLMAAGRSAAPAITPQEAMKLLASGAAIAVDVREASEVAEGGKIGGAVVASRSHLEFTLDPASPRYNPALRKDKIILLYCASGKRATLAATTFKTMGYTDVRNLGGFKDWVAAGGPIEK